MKTIILVLFIIASYLGFYVFYQISVFEGCQKTLKISSEIVNIKQ